MRNTVRESSPINELWREVKETESLYKLIPILESLPPSERRESLKRAIDSLLSVPNAVKLTRDEQRQLILDNQFYCGKIKDLEEQLRTARMQVQALLRRIEDLV